MSEPYGLPAGTAINYKQPAGFPPWVDELCRRWGLDSSTYPGHQEGDRPDIGAAPNPQGLNRGIDWTGDPDKMLAFAHWLVSVGPSRTSGQYGPPGLEMVIYRHVPTGEDVTYPSWVDFSGDLPAHTDHVHTRFSAAPIAAAPPPELSREDRYALAVISEGRKRNVSKKGVCVALTVPPVESGWRVLANPNVPESQNYPHDGEGGDHDSVGLFQQRQAWGPLSCTMDPACSAGLFFDGGAAGQRGLCDLDYDSDRQSPGMFAADVQQPAEQYRSRYDEHWDEAVALYDRLAAVPSEEGPFMALSSEEQRELLDRIRQLSGLYDTNPSKSRYADERVWNTHDFVRNIDGHMFDLITEHNAALGDQWAMAQIQKAAGRGDRVAANYLARLTAPQSTAPAPPPPATPPPATTPPQPTQYVPVPYTPPVAEPKTTGQLIGDLYQALEALRLADAMPIEARAPMQALIQVLATKNGLT